MAPPNSSPKRSDGLDTMARLLEQAKVELEINGIDNFDVDAVLTRAKAARSSMYHHFGSKFGLVYASQLDQLITGLNSDNAGLRFLVESSESAESFFNLFTMFIHTVGSPDNVRLRERRIQVFASATSNQQLAQAIETAQREGTKYLAETLEIMQVRGWIKPAFDLHAVAYFLQGMIFGHLILDHSHQPELETGWSNATILAISTVLGTVVEK